MGYRYRLHRRDLPGTPDMVFPSRKAVIFVHGCFWHNHQNCRISKVPKSRTEYWTAKFERNKARDSRNIEKLQLHGWRVMVLWECELGDQTLLMRKIGDFLGASSRAPKPARHIDLS
jgi:DNA mismatch endonuclease (patch repair protein)